MASVKVGDLCNPSASITCPKYVTFLARNTLFSLFI